MFGYRKLLITSLMAAATGIAAIGTASAETTLERIQRTKKLTVATEAAYPPMEFVVDGKITGMGSEILAEVAKDLGAEVEQLDLPFQGILPGLLAEKFDFVATSVGINPERAKKFAYTLPVGESTASVLKKAGDARITSVKDLNEKIVATQLASTTEVIARKIDDKLKADAGPGFKELKLFPSFNDCFLSVANGTADATLANLPVIQSLMTERPGLFEVVGPATETRAYDAWVVRPGDTDLRDAINKTLERLKKSGRYAELQQKWLHMTYDLPSTGYLPEGAL